MFGVVSIRDVVRMRSPWGKMLLKFRFRSDSMDLSDRSIHHAPELCAMS